MLTEQLKTIKKELGLEQDEKKALVDKFNDRMKNMKVPEHAMKVIKDEMVIFTFLRIFLEFSLIFPLAKIEYFGPICIRIQYDSYLS